MDSLPVCQIGSFVVIRLQYFFLFPLTVPYFSDVGWVSRWDKGEYKCLDKVGIICISDHALDR